MLYSESESAWLSRRAEKIAAERDGTLPVARSEVEAELTRGRASGHCALVVELSRLRAPGGDFQLRCIHER